MSWHSGQISIELILKVGKGIAIVLWNNLGTLSSREVTANRLQPCQYLHHHALIQVRSPINVMFLSGWIFRYVQVVIQYYRVSEIEFLAYFVS